MGENVLVLIALAILGYLLGSVNSSLIVGKFYGVDVRKHGSGNAGMTNTLRTLGKLPAILVIIGDVLKAIIACLIGGYFQGEQGLMVAGVSAILGHNWPVFFNFRGGKGVLTTLGVILMMSWEIGLILLLIFIIIVAISKYISLGSTLAAILFPVVAILLNKDMDFIIFGTILAALLIIKHKGNLSRLLKGNENKVSFKKTTSS